MSNQHAGLSHVLAEQRITKRHEQAANALLVHGARPPRRRRRAWVVRGWWQPAQWPDLATVQPGSRTSTSS